MQNQPFLTICMGVSVFLRITRDVTRGMEINVHIQFVQKNTRLSKQFVQCKAIFEC